MRWDVPPAGAGGEAGTVLAALYGVMAWTLSNQTGQPAEACYEALRRHITGTAKVTPAAAAAVMQSAFEDLVSP